MLALSTASTRRLRFFTTLASTMGAIACLGQGRRPDVQQLGTLGAPSPLAGRATADMYRTGRNRPRRMARIQVRFRVLLIAFGWDVSIGKQVFSDTVGRGQGDPDARSSGNECHPSNLEESYPDDIRG
jgi:hypothetical protein